MNYQKIYDSLVKRGQIREKPDCYCEEHHIVPRCMCGTDEKSNLTLLTGREHFLVHWLLVKIYPGNQKLTHAFWAMCNQKSSKQLNRYKPSSRIYAYVRELSAELHREMNIGKTMSKESREKLSKSNLGRKHPPRSQEFRDNVSKQKLGFKHSDETRKRMSQSMIGKLRSEETKKKMSESFKGRVISEETRSKISNSHIGKKITEETRQKLSIIHSTRVRKPHSLETRQKMSESQKGKVVSEEFRQKMSKRIRNTPKLSCKNCNLLFRQQNLKQHYNYCIKQKQV